MQLFVDSLQAEYQDFQVAFFTNLLGRQVTPFYLQKTEVECRKCLLSTRLEPLIVETTGNILSSDKFENEL
jgi:hypothetical protein